MEIEKYKEKILEGINIENIPVKDKWLKLISTHAKLYNLGKEAQDKDFLILDFVKDVFIVSSILNLRLTRILDLNRADSITRAKSMFIFGEVIGTGLSFDLDECEDSISKALLFIIREIGLSKEEFSALLEKDYNKRLGIIDTPIINDDKGISLW